MRSKVTTAVILAAGLGSRLKYHTQDQPKGFLQIDGHSLIERSLTILVKKGITEIIIGTGYLHEQFDSLKEKFPVTTFRNEDYSTTGSMYTLYILQHLIKESFLLLESDLLYDPVSVDYLLNDSREDIILASGPTQSGDEVYIQCSADSTLQQMSKDRSKLTHIQGELVGISKLSIATLKRMSSFSETFFKKGDRMLNYEDGLVGAAAIHPVHIMVIEDLVWCEIDNEDHLQRALTLIYPKIVQRIEKSD